MATVTTPGGRVGDDASHNRSPKKNWVEERGGLPQYIRVVRNGLMKEGHSEGRATALAVAAIKRWAAGTDNVSPAVQAAAKAALAEWEAMKSSKDDDLDVEWKVSEHEAETFDFDILHEVMETALATEAKDAGMLKMEYKDVGVSGVTVDDAEQGIVTTIVSVTGLRDNVKDVINPGAYTKTLATRTPKGVWSHAWDTPVSKTLDVKELPPGSPELPATLPNGSPWPSGAGALKVKTQFNLETQRGREAYSDVVFFGPEQEWSIGYQVPVGGARIDSKTGIRYIDHLELYEYSPVLFGAMPAARTATVKDAQVGYKSLTMPFTEFKEWCDGLGIETKGVHASPPKDDEPEDKDESPDDHGWDDDEDDYKEEKADGGITAYDYDFLVQSRDAIDAAIKSADLILAGEEGLEYDEKSLAEVVAANEQALGDIAAELKNAADAFDTAYEVGDTDGVNDFGNDVLEVIEKALEEAEDNAVQSALRKVAAAVASMAPDDDDEEEGADEETDDVPVDEDDTEKKMPKSVGKRPEMKADPIKIETKELDALRAGFAAMRQ